MEGCSGVSSVRVRGTEERGDMRTTVDEVLPAVCFRQQERMFAIGGYLFLLLP